MLQKSRLPSSWLKHAGSKALVLPQDVQWNTLTDCLETYLKTGQFFFKSVKNIGVKLKAPFIATVRCKTFRSKC